MASLEVVVFIIVLVDGAEGDALLISLQTSFQKTVLSGKFVMSLGILLSTATINSTEHIKPHHRPEFMLTTHPYIILLLTLCGI